MRHTCFELDKEIPEYLLHNNVNKRERNTPLLNMLTFLFLQQGLTTKVGCCYSPGVGDINDELD